jgi:hypothetical protein
VTPEYGDKLDEGDSAAKPAQISGLEKANEIKADVTVARVATRAVTAPSRRTNYPLVGIAYGFFALGIGINVWNAMTGGTLADMALPAALGVLAEAVVFFLPAWALTLPFVQRTGATSPLRCRVGRHWLRSCRWSI